MIETAFAISFIAVRLIGTFPSPKIPVRPFSTSNPSCRENA